MQEEKKIPVQATRVVRLWLRFALQRPEPPLYVAHFPEQKGKLRLLRKKSKAVEKLKREHKMQNLFFFFLKHKCWHFRIDGIYF